MVVCGPSGGACRSCLGWRLIDPTCGLTVVGWPAGAQRSRTSEVHSGQPFGTEMTWILPPGEAKRACRAADSSGHVASAAQAIGFGAEKDALVEVHAAAFQAVGYSLTQGLGLGDMGIEFREFACGQVAPLPGGRGRGVVVEEATDLGESEPGPLRHLDQSYPACRRGRRWARRWSR